MQDRIWRTGFQSNELVGVVFDDVPVALERWHASGIKVLYVLPLFFFFLNYFPSYASVSISLCPIVALLYPTLKTKGKSI